jgi:carbohydrate-selective porin OprB
MWRYPQISALFHEVPCIKLLVATYGHNRIDEQVTAGFRYNGPIPHRAQDSVAFGMVYRKSSDHFNQSYLLQSLTVLGAEKAFEVNYLFQATHWLVWRPSVQYLAEVGANPHQGNAVAAEFRLKVTF